jgi:hypothetical protein
MRKSENRGAIRRTTPVPVNASATVHVGIYRIKGAAPETVKRMPQTLRPPNLEEPLPACAGPAAAAVHAQTESRGARVREQERERSIQCGPHLMNDEKNVITHKPKNQIKF